MEGRNRFDIMDIGIEGEHLFRDSCAYGRISWVSGGIRNERSNENGKKRTLTISRVAKEVPIEGAR